MLLSLLLGILAVLIVFPGTPMARALSRLLVEPLAARLNRIRPGHLIFAGVLIALATALIVFFEWEGVRLIGMAAPEVMGWLAMFDAAAVLDLAAVAIAMAATTRFRAVRDRVLATAAQVVTTTRTVLARGRQRAFKARPTAPKSTRSDDPDPFGAYAFG